MAREKKGIDVYFIIVPYNFKYQVPQKRLKLSTIELIYKANKV